MHETSDLRIASIKAVTPPTEICEEIPITGAAAETTWLARQAIGNLLDGTDDRLMVVTGPCSIHDVDAAREADPQKRMRLLEACERIIVERDLPILPICQLVEVYMFDPAARPRCA